MSTEVSEVSRRPELTPDQAQERLESLQAALRGVLADLRTRKVIYAVYAAEKVKQALWASEH